METKVKKILSIILVMIISPISSNLIIEHNVDNIQINDKEIKSNLLNYPKSSDVFPQISFEELELDKSIIQEQTNLTPLEAGDSFGEAVRIQMTDGGFYRRGSIEFDLNNTQVDEFGEPTIFFNYFINDSSPVIVTLRSGSGTLIDEEHYSIGFEVFAGPDYEYWIGYKDTFEFDLPLSVEYPAIDTGDHFLQVHAFDLEDYEFSPSETIKLNVTIDHLKPGATPEGGKSQIFYSTAYDQILGIHSFLNNSGYINETLHANLGEFNASDASFAKGIGTAVYGILKSAEFLSVADNFNENILVYYLNMAYNIFELANKTMLEPTSNLFYYRPSESDPSGFDFVTYLSDNVYMLLAMGELQWMGSLVSINNQLLLNFNQTSVVIKAGELANRIKVMFEQNLGEYREKITITDYIEDTDPSVFDNLDHGVSGGIVYGDDVYLESLALLAETYFWQGKFSEMDDLVFYIKSNMRITTINGVNLLNEGIFAESYDAKNSLISNITTLIGNAYFVSHLNTYVREDYAESESPDILRTTLDTAGDIAQNILRVFGSEESYTSGLLYSSVNITDISGSEKLISTLDNSMMLFAINRLTINWEELNLDVFGDPRDLLLIDPTSQETIVRTWKRRSLIGIEQLFNVLYDDITNSFFAEYDDKSKSIQNDDNEVAANSFVANTFVLSLLADIFPVQMEVVVQDDVPVNSGAQVTLGLTQISTTGTWIWWDPFNPFKLEATVSIPEFGVMERKIVDLTAGFSGSETKFISFFYEVDKRGDYTVKIELSLENAVLLSQTITLTALGEVHAEYSESNLVFATDDESFTGTISLIDENGLPLASLSVEAALGNPLEISKNQFANKYIKTGRTDSSGKVSLKFTTRDIALDEIINNTKIFAEDEIPEFIEIELFINITNVNSFDLQATNIRVPVRVKLAHFYADFDHAALRFSTDDSNFDAIITILDESGVAVPNLRAEASLGDNITYSKLQFNNAYIQSGITDSSGKLKLSFDVSNFETDYINRIGAEEPELIVDLFVNITSPYSFNYAGVISVGVRVILANIFPRISPTNLEIVQGTDESYTFSVYVVNHEQNPISNAKINYSLTNIIGSANQVTTNYDGEATITLRDQILVQLSPPSATIEMIITHQNYPDRNISRTINILNNTIRIIANPVQMEIQEKTIFEQEKASIDIEVATEDLFGKIVNAFVSIKWQNPNNNKNYDLSNLGEHIAPYTFSIDPTNLPTGDQVIIISARKDGLTSSIVQVGSNQLNLNEEYEGFILEHIPVEIIRTITVTPATIQDIAFAAIGFIIAFLVTKIIAYAWDKVNTFVTSKIRKVEEKTVAEIKEIIDDDNEKLKSDPSKVAKKKKQNEKKEKKK